MRKQIDELLAKKMDRREFLKHLGVGTLVLFGLGSALKLLSSNTLVQGQSAANGAKNSHAYGASFYGGRPS